jgi:hypothetical protein
MPMLQRRDSRLLNVFHGEEEEEEEEEGLHQENESLLETAFRSLRWPFAPFVSLL